MSKIIYSKICSKCKETKQVSAFYNDIRNCCFTMFGYTIEELKTHLESKFAEGMNWDNYGYYGWHLDHIKPKSWFDCSDEKQLLECWSLANLQPLWAFDNMSKGNRFIG